MMKKCLFSIGIAIFAVAVLVGAGCSKEVKDTSAGGAAKSAGQAGDKASQAAEAPFAPSEEVSANAPAGSEVSEGETSTPAESATEITMLAKKWEFTPKTLTVKKGEKVRLSISSVDVDHGFAIPAFNIDTRLAAGQSTTVEFIAGTVGVFPFTCTVYCGAGHGDMRGEIVVTE